MPPAWYVILLCKNNDFLLKVVYATIIGGSNKRKTE
jgi:hypothetical protein